MIESSARKSWESLEATLRPYVARRVTRAVDVDDVIQEIFLRVQRGLPGLREDERFGPWIYKVARNAVADHRRAAARHPVAAGGVIEEADDHLDDAEGQPAAAELAGYLAPFLAELPARYRDALMLTELHGLTQREAADRLGVSLSGMKSRVQRGRQRLREALEACCHIALDARGGIRGCERRSDGRAPDGCCP